MNTMDTVWLTSGGMRRLKAEHAQLKNYIHKLRRDIRSANLHFDEDISAEKKLEQQVAQSKLGHLERILHRAKQLSTSHAAGAAVGSRVQYKLGAKTHIVTLVHSVEADPSENRISIASPLGSALVGKQVGDVAFMVTPVGERKFQIVSVS